MSTRVLPPPPDHAGFLVLHDGDHPERVVYVRAALVGTVYPLKDGGSAIAINWAALPESAPSDIEVVESPEEVLDQLARGGDR